MKKSKCRHCKKEYVKTSVGNIACSMDCALVLARTSREKKERKAEYEQKVKMRTRREWVKLAQSAFNAFIRERDKNSACISCGKSYVEMTSGGAWDCGHYLSVGSHPELRFNEDNAAKQCKKCNGGAGNFTRKNHTVQQAYRENLIKDIGLARVEFLEGPHEPANYVIAELIEIIAVYKEKTKRLKSERT